MVIHRKAIDERITWLFDLGWPHLGEVLAHYVQRMVGDGRRVLMLITYHFSRGDPQRGGAGFDHDTGAATGHTYAIKRQIGHIFGTRNGRNAAARLGAFRQVPLHRHLRGGVAGLFAGYFLSGK